MRLFWIMLFEPYDYASSTGASGQVLVGCPNPYGQKSLSAGKLFLGNTLDAIFGLSSQRAPRIIAIKTVLQFLDLNFEIQSLDYLTKFVLSKLLATL